MRVTSSGISWPLVNAGDMEFQPDGIVNDALRVANVGSAVNGVLILASVGGIAPTISGTGADADVGLVLAGKGAGNVVLQAGQAFRSVRTSLTLDGTAGTITSKNGAQLDDGAGNVVTAGSFKGPSPLVLAPTAVGNVVIGAATASQAPITAVAVPAGVNGLTIQQNTTGQNPTVSATGADANVGMNILGKGSGSLLLSVNGNLNYIQLTGTNGVIITGNGVQLDDGAGNVRTNGGAFLVPSGVTFGTTTPTGSALLGGGGALAAGQAPITATAVASGVNGVTVSNGATGGPPKIAATGSDANVGLIVATKGTGKLLTQAPFAAGANVTASRNITGVATNNGNNRRAITVTVRLTGAATGTITVLFATTAGGQLLGGVEAAFLSGAVTNDASFTFFADPGVAYSVSTAATGTGASAALQQWIEVDL